MSPARCVLLSVIFAASLAVPAQAQAPEKLVGAWLAEDIRGGGVLDRVQTKIEIGEDGSISGSGGCNRIAGKAEFDDDEISFGPLASTRMACPEAVMDQEQKFHEALDQTREWKIGEQGKLLFLDDDGNAALTFAPMDAAP